MPKSVDDIMSEYAQRRTVQGGRNNDFFRLQAFYQGLFFDNIGRDMVDGAGRIVLRDSRRTDRSSPLVANLLKPIVDDYVALTGVLPDIKVPAPDGDQVFADMVEKYHYGVWHASTMRLQIKAMAWWNSCLGSCAAVIWPDFRRKHAVIRFVGPDKVYGAADMIDPYAFSSAIVTETFAARSIKDYFPDKRVADAMAEMDATGRSTLGRLEIVRWFDKDEVVTILGREETSIRGRSKGERKIEALREIGRAKHNLGYCTVIPFYNQVLPGDQRSISDIEEAVGLNQYINFLLNSHEETVKQEIFAPLILEDASKAPEDIHLDNPTEIIPLNPGGKAYRLQTSGAAANTVGNEISRTTALIEYVTGTSQARTVGRVQSSISSGRLFEKAQGPQMNRVDVRNEINAQRLERVNEMSVLMTDAMFPNDDIHLFGTHSRTGGLFKTTIKGSDLQAYTFNQVLYSPSMYMGFENRLTAVLQMLGGDEPLATRRWAIEFLGTSDHPDEMAAEIDADMDRRVRQRASLAQAAQGGPTQPLANAVALEAGATKIPSAVPPMGGPTGAPAAAGVPPPMGAGPGGASGGMMLPPLPEQPPTTTVGPVTSGFGGSIADQVREAIASITLKGAVYVEETDGKVSVYAPDKRDMLKLRRLLMPMFKGKVIVKETKRIPPTATEVTGRQLARV